MATDDPSKSIGTLSAPPNSTTITLSCLLAGIGAWIFLEWAAPPAMGFSWQRGVLVLCFTLFAAIPHVNRPLMVALDRARNPSLKTIRITSLLIALGSAAYFVLTAFLQHRDLFAKTNDDCSYLIQIQMLARGRLWMPAHPLGDFFQSLYVLTKPVYCSIYFPGAALMYVPTIWLNFPHWLLPALISGAAVAMTYRVVTELIDHVAGLLAAIVMISLSWMRILTVLFYSQMPMLLLALIMVWACLKWRRNRHWAWAAIIGAAGGWGLITRPADAVCFLIPVAIAMIFAAGRRSRSELWRVLIPLTLCAAPFIALQLAFNVGVTGRWFDSPYTLYLRQEVPGGGFGFHQLDPAAAPLSSLPQFHADYELSKTYFAVHQPNNFWKPWISITRLADFPDRPPYLAMIADTTLPMRWMIVLLPPAALGLSVGRRWILVGVVPLFLLVYAINPFFLEHYAIVLIPVVLLAVNLGIRAIADIWPGNSKAVESILTLAIIASSFTGLWEINRAIVEPKRAISDEPFSSLVLRETHELFGERDVILFRQSDKNPKIEPVYNTSDAWPDDAEVIRAHDLGPRNGEIVQYYAQHQPDRVFRLCLWTNDGGKQTMHLIPIGTAAKLAQRLSAGEPVEHIFQAPVD